MSRRISSWNFFSIMNTCLLMVLMVTTVQTSTAIRRITRVPKFRGIRNHGFGDFTSPFANAFSIDEPFPSMRRPRGFSIGQHIPGMRRPGRSQPKRIRGFDFQTASSFQQNSYMRPPPSFQANFNPAKPMMLPPSSSLMFLSGIPTGYKPSTDIFDAQESISIGKLEAFLIHGDGEKPNPGDFQIHVSKPRQKPPQKQRPRQPPKNPIMSESLNLLDHGPKTNLIIPFQDLLSKDNLELQPKRKPDILPPLPNPLVRHPPRQQQRPRNVRGEGVRHVPLTSPLSGPNELHIIIHNAPPVQQQMTKDFSAIQPNYGAQRNPPPQLQFDARHPRPPAQTQVSMSQKHNHPQFQVPFSNSNRPPPGGHAPRQVTNTNIAPHQIPNMPPPQYTRPESTLFTQSSFVSSVPSQMNLLPPPPVPLNPNIQLNTGQTNYALTQPQTQITYNPSPVSPQHIQQQINPVMQLPQQGITGSQATQQSVQPNYIPTSPNDQRGHLQGNVQVPQNYITFPQNDQRLLQNTQSNYISTLQNGHRVPQNYASAVQTQNVQQNYVPTSQHPLQQNGPPRQSPVVPSAQSVHASLPQNGQSGHTTTIQYKQAVTVQQVNPPQQVSTAQFKQGQQTYLPPSQNFGFASSSQLPTPSTQGGYPQSGPSPQNGPTPSVSNTQQSYISTSSTGQVSYGSPDETRPTHLSAQQVYAAAPQNTGVRTTTHAVEQSGYTGTAQSSGSGKHASQTLSHVQPTSDQKSYPPLSESGQFYTTTNQQEASSYVTAPKPITFTINPSSQTTAKYVIVNSSGTDNNAGNNVVYRYKSQPTESHAPSSTGYITPGTTYSKESSSVYVNPGTTYNKDLSNSYDPDAIYTRQPSSASSNTFTKHNGEGEDEEFGGESTNDSSYKVVYIPLDILKNFLSKGTGASNE